MDKIKILFYVIAIEIFTLIILLTLLFVNYNLNYLHNDKIIFSNNDIIYLNNSSVPFTGKMLDTLDNKLIVEFNVVNGLKQGKFSLLTMAGNFAVQGYMNKNKNDGNWIYYFANGQIECEGEFDNDEPSGRWIWYYQNGAKKCEGIYLNGKPEGRWTKFNDDGSASLIINYDKGELINFVQLDKPTSI